MHNKLRDPALESLNFFVIIVNVFKSFQIFYTVPFRFRNCFREKSSKDSKESIIKYIRSLNKNLEIKIIHAGSLFKTNLDDKNVQKYIQISTDILGKNVEIVSSEATSDAIYFSDKKIPTILTNPIGDFAHAPKEYIEKESLYTLYQIWEKMLKEDN